MRTARFAAIRRSLSPARRATRCHAPGIRNPPSAGPYAASAISARSFFPEHNPYIRHIVRRTREFLEGEIDPNTNEPYLKPVRVRLFGEGNEDAVVALRASCAMPIRQQRSSARRSASGPA